MPCLPGRYKLVELLCYVIMGFFPALVVLSPPGVGLTSGWRGPRVVLEMVRLRLLLRQMVISGRGST